MAPRLARAGAFKKGRGPERPVARNGWNIVESGWLGIGKKMAGSLYKVGWAEVLVFVLGVLPKAALVSDRVGLIRLHLYFAQNKKCWAKDCPSFFSDLPAKVPKDPSTG